MRLKITLLAILVWSIGVAMSLWTQQTMLRRTAVELARNDAISNLRKDMAIRKWAASMGGVFVDDSKVKDSPTLAEQERVVAERNTGQQIRLVSLTPIHILLGIQEMHEKEYGIKERLTSLQLRNLNNAPDDWEQKALKELREGAKMVSDVTTEKGGHGFLRLMLPLQMDKECLECHRDTLIPVGGLRGGADITIDLEKYRNAQEPAWRTIQYGHLAIWLMGIASILTTFVIARRRAIEHERADKKLHLAASVFTHALEGIMITAADGTIIDVNDAFTRITSYSRDEVLGRNPRLLNSGRQEKEFYAAMWRDLLDKGFWYGEVWNRRKNGEVYAEMLTISAVRDAEGITQQYVSLFSDITPFKEHQRQLEHIAHYDVLTSLPNRTLLSDRMHQVMALALRHSRLLAVIYLDLDGFKAINDLHGHEAGDQMLIALATRMKQALREGDTLARLGGDEFVAVLLDLDDIEASVPLLARLLSAAAQPVHVGDLMLQVSASVGVTFYPQAEDVDADQLLRQADQAMYQAKLAGKNRYHVFDAEQDNSIRCRHESLERIRLALSEREFVLYYQPKVNMRTGTVIGAEALIRWQHPEQGLLPPTMFLQVIENHQLAVEIGEWVTDTVLTQMALWREAGLDIPVSVNVGAYQLQQADFVDRLREILAMHPDVRPGDLEMEVLETSALDDLARVSQVIVGCREIGVMFALDDFGTGYSSLSYLKSLPVTLLKIDQSFVRDMLGDPDDLAILNGVIGLAAAFRREVIAEGVETIEHGTMLLQLGCELAQGYGIARPMPAREMPGWSATWRPDPAWVDLPSMSRDDLPLLFASVEHRAWIAAIENRLRGEIETPPPLDHHQCRFGKWLDGVGLARHGAYPAFHAIDLLHQQVHALAVDLLKLQAHDRSPEALVRLGELHGLRDALLGQLSKLVQESRQ